MNSPGKMSVPFLARNGFTLLLNGNNAIFTGVLPLAERFNICYQVGLHMFNVTTGRLPELHNIVRECTLRWHYFNAMFVDQQTNKINQYRYVLSAQTRASQHTGSSCGHFHFWKHLAFATLQQPMPRGGTMINIRRQEASTSFHWRSLTSKHPLHASVMCGSHHNPNVHTRIMNVGIMD